jgi:uncharacterized protein (TIGR02466 family)
MLPKQWIKNSEVHSLFPTLVWQIALRPEVHEPLDRRIIGRLDAMRGSLPGAGQSWQSPHGLHQLSEFDDLVAAIDGATRSVLEFLRIAAEPLQITGCWANVNSPGAAHRMHAHPNNFLSGVYYARVRPGGDTINFHDPRPQTGVIRPPVTELTGANTDMTVVRVAAGTLLLFPSWLPHSVEPNASAELRVSVSFNLMFARFAETLAQPLWGEEESGR